MKYGYNKKKISEKQVAKEKMVKASFNDETKTKMTEMYHRIMGNKENYLIELDGNIGEMMGSEEIVENLYTRVCRVLCRNDIVNDMLNLGSFVFSVTLHIFTYQHELTREAVMSVYKLLKSEQHGKLIDFVNRLEEYQVSYDSFNEEQKKAICNYIPAVYHEIGSMIEAQKEEIQDYIGEKKFKRGTIENQIEEYLKLREYYRLVHILYCKAVMIDMFYSQNFSSKFLELKKRELCGMRDEANGFLAKCDDRIISQLEKLGKKTLEKKGIDIEKIKDEKMFLDNYAEHINLLSEFVQLMQIDSFAIIDGDLYTN